MNITTRPEEELWHNQWSSGSYEWWYFDAEDVDSGISFVVIWFCGFPFSPSYATHYEKWKCGAVSNPPDPSNYSAFSFQLYEHGRELINFIKEGDRSTFESNPLVIGVRFEKSSFTYLSELDTYQLDIAFDFPARHRSVKASLRFAVPHRIALEQPDANSCGATVPRHQWLLSAPYAIVDGEIVIKESARHPLKTIRLQKADGYHDHNVGEVPMQEYIARWYWGRAFSERYHLIYYVIFYKNSTYAPRIFVLLRDIMQNSSKHYDCSLFQEEQLRRGFFAPLHGRILQLTGDGLSLTIKQHPPLDAGPFYLRFPSTVTLYLDNHLPIVLQGISEYLNPQRLYSQFFRFFTRSRILRKGESSFMYSIYNHFKLTIDVLKK